MNFINKIPLLPFAIIAAIYAIIYDTLQMPTANNENPIHHGIIEQNRNTPAGQALVIKIDDGKLVRLIVPSIEKVFNHGDIVEFKAQLNIPNQSNRHENDFPKAMRRNGISYTAFTPTDSISLISSSPGLLWKAKRLKADIVHTLANTSLDDNACEFLCAIIAGDTSELNESTRNIFSTAGVAHLLALSGMHVGAISSIILLLLAPINLLGARRFRIILTIFLLWSYAFVTGLSPSVTRAVIMATAVGTGFVIGRRNFSLNALLLAGIIILLINPKQIMMPGFQMSFTAAASIIIIMPLISTYSASRSIYFLASPIVVTTIATLCAGAIAAFHFHTFPLYFIIANIPAIVALPTMLFGGVLIILLESLSINSSWICEAVNSTYHIFFAFIKLISEMPAASIQGLHFSSWLFIPYFFTIAAIITSLYNKNKKLYYVSGFGIALNLICFGCSQKPKTSEDCFIVKAAGHTGIFYRYKKEAAIFSTAPPKIKEEAAHEIERNYSDYLSFHGIDSVKTAKDNVAFGNASYCNNLVNISGIKYMLVGANNVQPQRSHVNYCMITKGYRGDIIEIFNEIKPDTIILGSDLDIRSLKRYANEMQANGIPFKSLR